MEVTLGFMDRLDLEQAILAYQQELRESSMGETDYGKRVRARLTDLQWRLGMDSIYEEMERVFADAREGMARVDAENAPADEPQQLCTVRNDHNTESNVTTTARRKATHRAIESVWTIEFEVTEDGKAFIHRYSRQAPEGYDREQELMQGTIIEAKGRIATGLVLKPFKRHDGWANEDNATERYDIANPADIFSYGA